MDTIFAQATAPGRSGVAIIRISGDRARQAAAALGARLGPKDRRVCEIRDQDGALIDQAFALSFPAGQSFTGDETVELHLHGSPAIVARVSDLLITQNLRPAEAGEFTRRALENGQLDLAQVEGLADLIDAETEEQRKQAVQVFDGTLGDRVGDWRAKLVRAAALLEATIDFADEDVPEDVYPEVESLLQSLEVDFEKEIQGVSVRERIRSGFVIGIVGPPNAGKSTLLNRLAGREAAIISEHAGTTRDVIEVHMDLSGFPVTFLDTAGIRETEDAVEAIGVDRAKARAAAADLRVHLVPPGESPVLQPLADDIVLTAKADLQPDLPNGVSGLTGLGVETLLQDLNTRLQQMVSGAGIATRERHRVALQTGLHAIRTVLERLDDPLAQTDLLAEDLRHALRALDSILGKIDVEHLLDEIFLSFCIGK